VSAAAFVRLVNISYFNLQTATYSAKGSSFGDSWSPFCDSWDSLPIYKGSFGKVVWIPHIRRPNSEQISKTNRKLIVPFDFIFGCVERVTEGLSQNGYGSINFLIEV
jgi:hypothetical protein